MVQSFDNYDVCGIFQHTQGKNISPSECALLLCDRFLYAQSNLSHEMGCLYEIECQLKVSCGQLSTKYRWFSHLTTTMCMGFFSMLGWKNNKRGQWGMRNNHK
uniref:Uncharacterized protein n=1 Tax=Arion vulgaris TaxID=1028688 RepID=A0A0B7BWD0_9EUPU